MKFTQVLEVKDIKVIFYWSNKAGRVTKTSSTPENILRITFDQACQDLAQGQKIYLSDYCIAQFKNESNFDMNATMQ